MLLAIEHLLCMINGNICRCISVSAIENLLKSFYRLLIINRLGEVLVDSLRIRVLLKKSLRKLKSGIFQMFYTSSDFSAH